MSHAKTAVLLGLLTAIFLAVGFFFAGLAGATIGLIIAVVLNFFSYWYSGKIVLKIYRAKKSDNQKLNETISRLAKKAGIPKPKAYIIPTDLLNAFATGRSPKHAAVAVTTGLINRLSDSETEGVLAHEIAHIKNRDTLTGTVAATIAGALTWLAYIFYFGSDNRNAISFLLLFILAPLSASIIRMAISRSREYAADRYGAEISHPECLASALERIEESVKSVRIRGNAATSHMFIVNPFRGDSFINLFSTHPPTEKRVAALRSMM